MAAHITFFKAVLFAENNPHFEPSGALKRPAEVSAAAYELCDLKTYFMGSPQFSSGCPYDCEFCDIPALYGRNPRLKSPQQVIDELDKMRACGLADAVYFVDDNFIGNRRAVRELPPV